MTDDDESAEAPEEQPWQKRERHLGRLLVALDYYLRTGHSDEKIIEIVTAMMKFNREFNGIVAEQEPVMKVIIEMSDDARQAAIKAIRTELSYYEDNVYRYTLGGYNETHDDVISQRRTIANLKEALAAMGVD